MPPLLLLASNSPRRRELLDAAGFEFESLAVGVVERSCSNLTLCEITQLNAVRKGMSAARAHRGRVVLAADTLVALDDEIIGKPHDFEHAAQILSRLSGRIHCVCSSVFISDSRGSKSVTFHELSFVRFHPLNRAQINDYLAKVNPLDKAGAYGAQQHRDEIIAEIKGSYSNVVGLPMEATIRALRKFGIQPVQR